MTQAENLGLNEYLQPIGGPVTNNTGTISSSSFSNDAERNAVTNYGIQDITASKITAGTISGSVIYGGTISGTQVTAGTISANIGYLGTLNFNQSTGGTLVLGGTSNGNGVMQIKNAAGTTIIQGDNLGHHYYGTSGTQELIKVDVDGFHSYNTGGTTLYEIKNDGFFAYGTTTGVIRLRDTSASTVSYGLLGFIAPDDLYMASGNGKNMYIFSQYNGTTGGTLALVADRDLLVDSSANQATFQCTNNVELVCDSNDNGSGLMYFTNNNTNVYRFYDPGASGYRTLTMDSNKTAIMPTREGFNSLFCMESPEQWFMDFVEEKGKLDPLFEDVTVPPYKYIKVEDGGYQVWGRRKGKEKDRFNSATREQFESNDRFWGRAING